MIPFTVVKNAMLVGYKNQETKDLFCEAGQLCDAAVLTEDGAFYYLQSLKGCNIDEQATLFLDKQAYAACDGCANRLQSVTSGCSTCKFQASTSTEQVRNNTRFPKKKLLSFLLEKGCHEQSPKKFYETVFPPGNATTFPTKLDRRKMMEVKWIRDGKAFRVPLWLFDQEGNAIKVEYGQGAVMPFIQEPHLLLTVNSLFFCKSSTKKEELMRLFYSIVSRYAYQEEIDTSSFPISLPYSYNMSIEGKYPLEYLTIEHIVDLPIAFWKGKDTFYRHGNQVYQRMSENLDSFIETEQKQEIFFNRNNQPAPVYLYDGTYLYQMYADIKKLSICSYRDREGEHISHSFVEFEETRKTYLDVRTQLTNQPNSRSLIVVDEELFGDRPTLKVGDDVCVTHPAADKMLLQNEKGRIAKLQNGVVTVAFLNGYFHETFKEKEVFKIVQ